MNKILFLSLSAILFFPTSSVAEEYKFTGMLSIAVNNGNTFLNFGGPSIKMESEDYFGGASFFPSLRHDSSADEWTPVLGAGLYAGRKNFFVIMPSYYLASNWYTAFGIGYKF